MQYVNFHKGDFYYTSNKQQMQWEKIHLWLSGESYWAKNIPYDTMKTAAENSFCIGIFHQNNQIGFARIVTDYSTFGYLADVYVLEEHRKKGLSKIMMEQIMKLDWIKKLRRFMLATLDAHDLYRKYGFVNPEKPDRLMEINQSGMYEKK